jgi:hypothetical protein
MERTDILELMSTLKLYGMRAAYDEVMTTGIKRRHEPPRIVGDLLSAEIAEKQARSIKYRGHRAPRVRRDHQEGPGGLAGRRRPLVISPIPRL